MRTRQPGAKSELLAGAFSGMAALLEAGLPADRALDAAAETGNPRTRALFTEALQRVREGSSFATALEASGGVPLNAIGMLRAGEAQGKLAAAARRVAETLERRAELRSQVRAALTYPVFLAAAGSVSVMLIVGFVMPKFATLLADNSRALPASTRLLLSVSSIVEGNWAAILVAMVLLFGATAFASRSPRGASSPTQRASGSSNHRADPRLTCHRRRLSFAIRPA